MLLIVYLGYIIGLEYYKNLIPGAQHYEALGLRAGWLSVAQLPLLLLLAGKNNLIGLFTGISYERLNVFHRWVGRTVWLTATFHWAYQQYGWGLYGLTPLEEASGPAFYTGLYPFFFCLGLPRCFSHLSCIQSCKRPVLNGKKGFTIEHETV